MKKSLAVKQRKLIKGLVEGLTPTEAMRQAGYSESTCLKQQARTVGSSGISEAVQEFLEKEGLTDGELLKVLKEGLNATKVISAILIARDGEGMRDAHSMTRDFIEVPDYSVRHKYLETALKLRDAYQSEKNKPQEDLNTKITIEVVSSRQGKERKTAKVHEGYEGD